MVIVEIGDRKPMCSGEGIVIARGLERPIAITMQHADVGIVDHCNVRLAIPIKSRLPEPGAPAMKVNVGVVTGTTMQVSFGAQRESLSIASAR
jgi:hypothetical protein